MTTTINLKEIERRAFRATYQDGLWDIYYGLVVVGMSIFVYRPESGYSPLNIVMAVLIMTTALLLFRLGKKHITLPRMGQVRFGAARKQKARTLAIIMGIFVLFQLVLLGATRFGWFPASVEGVFGKLLQVNNPGLMTVALTGSFILGMSMLVIVHISDFPRGYYIALMMALAVFLMIYLNRPLYPLIIGVLIALPGVYLLLRFLKQYPLPREEMPNG